MRILDVSFSHGLSKKGLPSFPLYVGNVKCSDPERFDVRGVNDFGSLVGR